MVKENSVGYKVKGILGSILPFIYALLIQISILFIASICYGIILGVQLALGGATPDEIAIITSQKVVESNFILMVSAFSGLMWILVYGIWYKKSYVKDRKVDIKKILNGKLLILLTVLGIGLQFSISMILNLVVLINPEYFKIYEEIMNTLGMGSSLISFAYIVLIAPIAEELIFRGVIFEKCKKVLPFLYANILQAFLFALMHLNIVQSSYAFILGLFLGFVCYKRKSILPSIFLHFVINLAGVLPNVLFSSEEATQSSNDLPIMILVAIIATAMVVISIIKFNKMNNDNDVADNDYDNIETEYVGQNDSNEVEL